MLNSAAEVIGLSARLVNAAVRVTAGPASQRFDYLFRFTVVAETPDHRATITAMRVSGKLPAGNGVDLKIGKADPPDVSPFAPR